ncbi:MAG TPA: circadian clock protein KaiC [Ideonella sp.]|uniref:circadian clock protein KaiC n=1 Tax=Ideonella sp. TaxID=1929293 RepID=UPI002D123218|nr:circadian clock protein KaiC [Ideonella sp.]HSI47467.1 circadian clock protein KaiC [Ideonella sp.]
MPIAHQISKSRTGIQGLDELTGGGLPQGRPTLVCGGPGCGKTLLGIEFLINGALHYGEPGVIMAFEETAADLTLNVASLGFDLDDLVARRLLAIDFVRIERSEVEQYGDFDLEGLFIRLGHAIDRIGAKRVMLDTVESLFSGLPNQAVLRAEVRRLFRWLKDRQVTAIVTGERGSEPGALTRQGLEEYVSDCVIMLDHRVIDMVSSRRLRVVKYRGSTHGTNEYPFLIDSAGISVFPITSVGLQHKVSSLRVPSGVPELDAMLGGEGYFKGSSVLASGTAGTGKTSLAAHFAAATCRRGERVIFFSFEESADQIMRNMLTIGLDLAPFVEQDLLRFHAARPTHLGLEMHLATMLRAIQAFDPQSVIVDPLSSFVSLGGHNDVLGMLLRLVDALKVRQITGFFTSLSAGEARVEKTDAIVSSLVDTWLMVRDMEFGGERNRGLYVLKSRGMQHSNQIREFSLTRHGIELRQPYTGPAGVLTGSARLAQEAQERSALLSREQEIGRKQKELDSKRAAMEAQVAAIRAEFASLEAAALAVIDQAEVSEDLLTQDRQDMAQSRRAEAT